MSVFSFICKHCGPSEHPCEHALELIELKILREMQQNNTHAFHVIYQLLKKMEEDQRRCCKLLEAMLLEILHILNRPQSATLTVQILSGGTSMPKTVVSGGTGQAVFHEWSGPTGTGVEVPLEGTVTFSSDNPPVATVDPNTGAITSVGPEGAANISGVDASNSLTASDVFTVKVPTTPPPPAVSATLTIT